MDPTSNGSEENNWLARFYDAPPHVMLAEDDPELRNMIATALRHDGIHIMEAHDGSELLDRISDWLIYRWPYDPLDLILSDVRMPGFSGTEIVSSLRRSHWDTPVILMTAYDEPNLRDEAATLGVSSVFSKPFDIDDLRTAVLNTVSVGRTTPHVPRWWEYEEQFDALEAEYAARRRKPG
jgi:CheY-like chemotaxis protein